MDLVRFITLTIINNGLTNTLYVIITGTCGELHPRPYLVPVRIVFTT